jgi:hypothetical protein
VREKKNGQLYTAVLLLINICDSPDTHYVDKICTRFFRNIFKEWIVVSLGFKDLKMGGNIVIFWLAFALAFVRTVQPAPKIDGKVRVIILFH